MIISTSFETAKDNMEYDARLFNACINSNERFFRLYQWKHCGITQSEKRPIDELLIGYDCAYRLTGGGIVFHSPGDLVFSIGGRLGDDFFSSKSSDIMKWVADLFYSSLQHFDVSVTFKATVSHEKNIQYCASYSNPYELYVNGSKVFGFALKRTRSHFLIQGVLHCCDARIHFKNCIDPYEPYFSKGIDVEFDVSLFSSSLESKF